LDLHEVSSLSEKVQKNIMMASTNMPTGPAATPAAPTTAILVINSHSGPMLCPFFQKCDGVLLIDGARQSKEFHQRDRSSAKPLCDLIVELKPRALICGFVGEAEKQKLRDAGIDVRLGSCSCSIDELLAGFQSLPRA
jgi:hypothetical protein